MVLVPTVVNNENIPLYMDDGLYNQLLNFARPIVQKKDFDFVIAVDGEEGSGKSVFAMQIGKILDPDLHLDNICFTPDEFVNAVTKAKKNQCIIFDEAFTGMSNRASLSEINKLIVSLMMEMRQKNLFVIVVMPTFFMFEKYVVFHRAKGFFHVYINEDMDRGQWRFFNRKSMRYLYIKGKKYYDYEVQDHTSFGKFRDQYMVDETAYRAKKAIAFSKKRRKTKADAYKEQRDVLLYAFMREIGKSQREMSRFLAKYDINLSHVTLNEVFHKMHAQFSSSDE